MYRLCGQCGTMLRHRTYPSGGVGRIAVLALTAVIVVALLLVLTCSAMDIPAMHPKLENATVDPGTTSTWDQSFTYAVNCSLSDKVSVTLEVYNLSLHDWTAIGDRTYTGTGEWQSLTWEEVNICSGKCDGTSSYRFKYNGSILLTESGPTIAPPTPLPPTVQMFKNASVKPAYGHYNDSFTYSVFTQLNQTTNITLEVFDISCYEWKEAGENQSYTETGNWQLLSWANVTNVSAVDGAGVASYRFLFLETGERRESVVFYGPELDLYSTSTPTVIYSGGGGGGGGGVSWRRLLEDEKLKILAENLSRFLPAYEEIKPPELINATVTPENGSWHESYDYYAEVEHPDRADMWLTLEVYCPGQRENRTISTQRVWLYDDANIAKVEWRGVNVFSEEDVRANESPRYYIHYNDGCNKGFWGPYYDPKLFLPPNLTDPFVSPEAGTYKEQFEYKVHVMDEEGDDVNVTLHIVDSEGAEIYRNKTQVSGSELTTGKTVSWTYSKFTEREANKTLEYMFIASDGNASANISREGPHIMPVPPIEPLYPLDLISGFFLLAPLFVVFGSSCLHGRKVKRRLENAGFDVKEKRKNLQINDPYFYLVEISWIAAVTALLISSIFITLRAGLISSGIIILILSIVASILIILALGRLPVLKCEYPPLKRCYQECSISKRDSYKKVAGVSFTIAIVSIIFAFGGYVIPYYHDPILIGGINFWSFYLYIVASILFAACIFLLLSPMLSDLWRWRKKCF